MNCMLLIAILYVLFINFPHGLCECDFPEFLQTKDNDPSWFVTYQSSKLSITVKHSKMILKECKINRKCEHSVRNCVESHGGSRFKIQEYRTDLNAPKGDNLYRCIQFIYHSKSVVQIRITKLFPEETQLCDDTYLRLNKYPMVSPEHALDTNKCPIIGGYDFKLFRYGEKTPICDDIFLPLRIESNCTRHEGIKLYFRRRNCSTIFAGRQIESEPLELQCVASWEYMHYMFAMVKWHGTTDFWCVRVAKDRNGNIFEMYVYFGGVCPSDYKYYDRMLILKHFKTHYVTGICADQNIKCSYQHCSTHERDNCKLSCALCEPEMEERPCTLPIPYHGHWNSLQDPTKSALIIENQTFTQDNVQWECVDSQFSNNLGNRRVLKLKFNNGCYPRYKCIELENPVTSMIRYKFSKDLFWPIDSIDEVCEDQYFSFESQIMGPAGIASTSNSWVYYVKKYPDYTNCKLPWYIPKAAYFEMYDNNHSLANQGCLVNGNRNGGQGHLLRLDYTYENINKHWNIYKRNYCIASIKFLGENEVLITRNVVAKTYMCWTFMEDRNNNYIYIFSAIDCGNGTNKQLIYNSAQKALMMLVLSKNSTSCELKKEKSMSSDDALSNLTKNNIGSSRACRLRFWGIVIVILCLLCICFT